MISYDTYATATIELYDTRNLLIMVLVRVMKAEGQKQKESRMQRLLSMRFLLLVHIVRTVPFRLGLTVATTNSTLPSTSDPLSTIIEAFQEFLTKLI